jgi:ribosomal protein S18 acetylase RimI-like enzyme
MASRVEVTVEPLSRRRKDLDDAGAVAARAFMWDPFFEFLSPAALVRARGLGLYFRSVIRTLGPKTVLSGARDGGGRLVGVAAWVEPGGWPPSIGLQLRALAGAFRALVPRPPALVQGSRYLLAIEKVHPHEEHWYLALLVVDPSVQRLGIGGLLQQPMLEQADSSALDCYLETQNEANLAYYRRFGYEVDRQLHPVRKGPPLWTMRRPAGGAG